MNIQKLVDLTDSGVQEPYSSLVDKKLIYVNAASFQGCIGGGRMFRALSSSLIRKSGLERTSTKPINDYETVTDNVAAKVLLECLLQIQERVVRWRNQAC